jgi:hypothetical protein
MIKDAPVTKDPELYRYYCSVGGECPLMLSRTQALVWDASDPERRFPLSGDKEYLDKLSLIV